MKFQEKPALNPHDESAKSILGLSNKQLKCRFQHSSTTGSNRKPAPSTRVYECQCTDGALTSSSSSTKTPLKTEKGGTRWGRFSQGFSNHHNQIPAVSPFAAYSLPTLELSVTVCASTPTLLLYFIHSIQPCLYCLLE